MLEWFWLIVIIIITIICTYIFVSIFSGGDKQMRIIYNYKILSFIIFFFLIILLLLLTWILWSPEKVNKNITIENLKIF